MSRLFAPLNLRDVTLKNRIVVSPMAMYSAVDGVMTDFHLVHLGRFALGGAGLVFMEATAVSPEGRITPGCAGLWNDHQAEAAKRIVDFLHAHGAASGMQLGHSGFKGSSSPPWDGGGPLASGGWATLAPGSASFDRDWPAPKVLDDEGLRSVVAAFQSAAERADLIGIDVLEIHAAHGYLLHQFLSPLANHRSDRYGGDLAGRMRFPLEVVDAVRQVWPASKPLFVRISAVDGIDCGWSLADSVVFARALAQRGVDVVDCSTGGLRVERSKQVPARDPGFQVPYASAIRREAGIATMAVGLIREPAQAEQILADGAADLVALAREMLLHPNWAAAARAEAGAGWDLWPVQFRYWLERRARTLAKS